jgi:hypothetical protein
MSLSKCEEEEEEEEEWPHFVFIRLVLVWKKIEVNALNFKI